MRWTNNKIRNLLLESNYRLVKGYQVKKRSRLGENMALSFLSGQAEMKSLEARILQNAARNKILEAKKMESSMNEDFGLIGLDEIAGKKKEKRQEKKAVKKEKRQEKKAVKVQKRQEKKSGKQAKPTQREVDTQNDMIIPESRGLSPKEEAIENKITEARDLQDEAIRVEQESKDADVKKSGFNKNILLFGGLGAAALLGIYFLNNKK